ncbi:hypothetical protein J6590_063799 [Homalodisca vitripennis]|nr:hypothetical protein J6590_063799 [Homalodisca vitripennis]
MPVVGVEMWRIPTTVGGRDNPGEARHLTRGETFILVGVAGCGAVERRWLVDRAATGAEPSYCAVPTLPVVGQSLAHHLHLQKPSSSADGSSLAPPFRYCLPHALSLCPLSPYSS